MRDWSGHLPFAICSYASSLVWLPSIAGVSPTNTATAPLRKGSQSIAAGRCIAGGSSRSGTGKVERTSCRPRRAVGRGSHGSDPDSDQLLKSCPPRRHRLERRGPELLHPKRQVHAVVSRRVRQRPVRSCASLPDSTAAVLRRKLFVIITASQPQIRAKKTPQKC